MADRSVIEDAGAGQLAVEHVALVADLEATRARLEARAAGDGGEPDPALGPVVAALGRVAEGTYGACTDCGAAIPIERLAAVPTASRCVACQQRRE